MIASWPGKIQAGSQTDHQSVFYDVLPTLCDLVDIDVPETDGISFLPTLLGKDQQSHDFLYWEFPSYGGQQAVRLGEWKGIRRDILKNGNTDIELYNLAGDIQEQNNVADEFPDIVKQMKEIMQREHVPAEIERFRMEAIGDD